MKMRTLLSVCLLAVLATPAAFAVPAEVKVTLAQDGKPAATIMIAKEPTLPR